MEVPRRQQRGRRTGAPYFGRWMGTGAVLGFLVGVVVVWRTAPAADYSAGSQVGYLGVMFAFVGALLFGVVAVVVDRRR